MAITITIEGQIVGAVTIPERTFKENEDFSLSSPLKVSEMITHENIVISLNVGENSQIFRDYANRIGSREVTLTIT